jgi:hypothetical protein
MHGACLYSADITPAQDQIDDTALGKVGTKDHDLVSRKCREKPFDTVRMKSAETTLRRYLLSN